MGAWLTEVWPWLLLGGLFAAFGVYLAVILKGEGDFDLPAPGLARAMDDRDQGRSSSPTVSARPASRAPKAPPRLRPAAGAVAAGGGVGATNPFRLLRTLDVGPDMRRQAAAKALSVPYAGSADPQVGAGLVELFRRTDVSDACRAEAYVALRVVMGEDLDRDEEVGVRLRFPEGVDLDWVDSVDADLGAG